MLDGVDRVRVAAPPGCEEAARSFYGELLGLSEADEPEALRGRGGVWFRVGPQQLHVGVDMDFTPVRKARPWCAVRACDAALERLRAPASSRRRTARFPGCAGAFSRIPAATGSSWLPLITGVSCR